jgi:hypothetical protein
MAKPFQCESGTYTGTGAVQTITLGFKPKLVLAFNVTDGDTLVGTTDTLADGTGFSIVAATAALTNGFTLSDSGFSLGTSAVANESAKVYHYLAIGGN